MNEILKYIYSNEHTILSFVELLIKTIDKFNSFNNSDEIFFSDLTNITININIKY